MLALKNNNFKSLYGITPLAYFKPKAALVSLIAFSSSQGNNFTFIFTSFFLPLLKTLSTTFVSRPMCPYEAVSR